MLSLDDWLRYLPFAALHDGRDWPVRRYAFSAFRDARDLDPGSGERAAWRIAGFGAAKALQGFQPLPSVATELHGIVREDGSTGVLPGIVRLDEAFDRKELAGAMSGAYLVIHIASHFALDAERQDASFLLLGDGDKLPLNEFRTDGRFNFTDVDLLVLSACDTAMSSADASGTEVESTAATAQKLGAAAVLASLWPVSDASTALLMKRFYAIGGAGKESNGDALRQAQIAILDGKVVAVSDLRGRPVADGGRPAPLTAGFAHPFYWAPSS